MKRSRPPKSGDFNAFRTFALALLLFSLLASAEQILVNHIGYETRMPKSAVIETNAALAASTSFTVVPSAGGAAVFTGTVGAAKQVTEWFTNRYYCVADFSALTTAGTYKVTVNTGSATLTSATFKIGDDALLTSTLSSILGYYLSCRADEPTVWAYEQTIPLQNQTGTKVDVRGGWFDASGDIGKYLSHLSILNFLSPQQQGLVTWSFVDVLERIPAVVESLGKTKTMQDEALWGADFLKRMLSTSGYFYTEVTDGASGVLANRMIEDPWPAAFREGAGMAIAGLARVSTLKMTSQYFTSTQYLDAAKTGFAHLLTNNLKYDEDGKENIIDDYCALMAATELYNATQTASYLDAARTRAQNIVNRMTTNGWWKADDAGTRPYWHAAEAGLPIIALCRYLDKETDATRIDAVKNAIKKSLDYEMAVTGRVSNPFQYPRQNFLQSGTIKEGFFIPHDNPSMPGFNWWQGENARLASLAAAAIIGSKKAYGSVPDSLAAFAVNQMSWITGRNPYNVCFMLGLGINNPSPPGTSYGQKGFNGGISNGITGSSNDGKGISQGGGELWRYAEQWIPHSAWYMIAAAAFSENKTPTQYRNAPKSKSNAGMNNIRFNWIKNGLILHLAQSSAVDVPVSMCTSNGKTVGSGILKKGMNLATLSLPRLSHGVYCVKIGNLETYKINIQ